MHSWAFQAISVILLTSYLILYTCSDILRFSSSKSPHAYKIAPRIFTIPFAFQAVRKMKDKTTYASQSKPLLQVPNFHEQKLLLKFIEQDLVTSQPYMYRALKNAVFFVSHIPLTTQFAFSW